MDLCVVGAGAIGGTLAVRLTGAGVNVSVVARGPHADAIRTQGLTLLRDGSPDRSVRPACVAHPEDLPPQDVVLIAVKGPDLQGLASIPWQALLRPGGLLVYAMNGIPWWFGRGTSRVLPSELRERLDPGGKLAQGTPRDAIVGAVVQFSSEVIRPGVLRQASNGRDSLILGRPDGSPDAALDALLCYLEAAGFAARLSGGIHHDIWTKTLLAASTGPVAALAGADLGEITADPACFELLARLMHEGQAIGRAWGLAVDEDVEARLRFYRGKPIVPSMLQSARTGRPLEIDNGIGAFSLMARHLGVHAPVTCAVAALLGMRDRRR